MDKLGINLGYLVFQIINFLIMVIVLYAVAYKPILKMLNERKKKIAQGLEDARVAAEARDNAEQEAQKIIADAQNVANHKIREATERAETITLELKAKADADIAKEREATLADVQQECERILSDVRGQIAALAMAATQKLIGEALDERRQSALIDEFFSGVKAGKVTMLDDVVLTQGGNAEVTSALVLSSREQETIKNQVQARIGSSSSISFRVDPDILGGLVLRVGDRVLDGSVAGQLENMRKAFS